MTGQLGLAVFALSQPAFLLIAWTMGSLAQRILRSRGRAVVTGATMTVISVLGVSLGLLLASVLTPNSAPWRPTVVLIAFAVDVLVLALASGVIWARRHADEIPSIPTLIADGESDRLEFKSSARWNLRTDKRDERMELVIAKTVAAFLNSAGGALLIGVSDDGRLLGLANDFSTLRTPDADRFELWLRDLLHSKLDATAAGLPSLDFLQISAEHVADGQAAPEALGALVCRVRCPSAMQPVYLRGKGSIELWVRVGNSTRALAIDDAVSYIRHRWPQSLGSATRDRLSARRRSPITLAAELAPAPDAADD